MFEQPIAISVIPHDSLPDSALARCDEITDIPCNIRERLEFMAQKVSTELKSAVLSERQFGELNDKTMYIAPFFSNVMHASAQEIELEQISLYPLAMDPCFAGDPLLGLLPQYGHATALMCTPLPLNGLSRDSSSEVMTSSSENISIDMAEHSERGSSAGAFSEENQDDGSTLDEDHDMEGYESSEDVQPKWNDNPNWDVDAREYFCPATEYGTETSFYHDPRGTSADETLHSQSGTLDYRFLARLTVELVEDTTPLALACLAQENEIYSALSSALFQRLAWGIVDPLMGISFDRMGTIVRIVFGWIEEPDDSKCSIVHVSHEATTTYDLSDSRAALNFALRTGSEARRFADLRQRALEHYPRLLDSVAEHRLKLWRIDQKDLTSEFERRETHTDSRIRRWLDITDPSSLVALDEYIDGSPQPSPPQGSTMPESNHPKRSATSKKGSNYGQELEETIHRKTKKVNVERKKEMEQKTSSSHSTQITDTYAEGSQKSRKLRKPPPASSSIRSSATKILSHISASTLAAGGTHADKSYLIRLFMLDRLAMTRTLPVFSMLSDANYKIDPTFARICKDYYRLTSFAWLDNDMEKKLGDDVKKFRIFQHGEWASRRLESLANIGRFPGVEPLSGTCGEILGKNLWMIEDVLHSVWQLRGHGWKQAKELECRIHFDRLLMILFHGKADSTAGGLADEDYPKTPHVMVSLERNLQLPRGDVSEAISLFWGNTAYDEIYKITDAIHKVYSSDRFGLVAFANELRSKPELALFNPTAVTISDPAAQGPKGDRSTSNFNPGGATSSSGDTQTIKRRSYVEACAQLSLQEDIKRLRKYLVDVEDTHRKFAVDAGTRDGEQIITHSNKEPERAICDSIAYLRIPSVFQSIKSAAAFNMIRSPASSPGRSPEVGGHTANTSPHYQGLSGLRQHQMIRTFHPENSADIYSTAQSYAVAAKALLEDRNEVLVLNEEPVLGTEISQKRNLNRPIQTDGTSIIQDNVLDMRRDLFLPIAIFEHKKLRYTSIATGVFQGRMCAIASTKYYAALGVYGVPVYVIVTEGPTAVVTVTYAEKWVDHPFDKKKYEMSDDCSTPQPMPTKVHIIERNAVCFDISDPLGILNFATFLIKLRVEQVPKVLKQLGDVVERLQAASIPLKGTPPRASWQNTTVRKSSA